MKYRTIMIMPEFSNLGVIQQLRRKYDPLADFVKPHISLVYSFLSDLMDEEMKAILTEIMRDVKSFPIGMKTISKYSNEDGHFLFLDVNEGRETLTDIHNLISQKLLPEKFDKVYAPHLTIGQFQTQIELEHVYSTVQQLPLSFFTYVDKITVEQIGEWGESILLYEIPLQ